MNMQSAVLHTLTDSGPAEFTDLIGATCAGADDFNVNLLPGVLYHLINENKVKVNCGVYSVSM